MSSLWAKVGRAVSESTVRNHCQGGRADSEQPETCSLAGCSLLTLLLLLTLFVGAELINVTINSKHGFVQLWGAWVEQRGDGKGAVPAVLADLPLLEMLLIHCTSKPDMAKFTSLLSVSEETETHSCTVLRLGHTGRQW